MRFPILRTNFRPSCSACPRPVVKIKSPAARWLGCTAPKLQGVESSCVGVQPLGCSGGNTLKRELQRLSALTGSETRAGDPDFRAIRNPNEQVATRAACCGQTFFWNTDHGISSHA